MGGLQNDGLLMRTRSGDIDPGLLTWLQMRTAWTPERTDYILNQCSGWSGMSGGIDDMSKLLKDKSEESHLAFDLFCYRIRKTLGSYIAVLGGLDGIVFSGGISENNVDVCHQLLLGLEYFGIRLCDSLPPNPASVVDHPQLPVVYHDRTFCSHMLDCYG
jgi:acetate kinase